MPEDVDYPGAPTETDMVQQLLPEPDEMYGYRRAFMTDNEAPNRQGNAVEYPRLGENSDGESGFEGELIEIADEDPHPVISIDYDGIVAGWGEYGWAYHISFKDIKDATVNLRLITAREDNKKRMRGLDAKAGAVLEANHNTDDGAVIGDAQTPMNYNALVDAQTYLDDQTGYSGDVIVASASAYGEWLKNDDMTNNTEQFAGELRGGGTPDNVILDLPVVKVRRGPLQGTNSAYLVDSGAFGWESPRRPFDVVRERNNDNRRFEYLTDGRYDWVPTNPRACLKIAGGVPQ